MSAEATGWVFRHSPYVGTTFVVHLSIADVVNDVNDYELWASQTTLAIKARTTRKTANTALATLIEDGFLALIEEAHGRPNRYRFLMPDVPTVFPRGVTPRDTHLSRENSQGVTPRDTNPREPKREPKTNASVRLSADGDDTPVKRSRGELQALDVDADAVTQAWWEQTSPRPTPAGGYVGVRRTVRKFHRAGWTCAELVEALPEWSSYSHAQLTSILRRRRNVARAREERSTFTPRSAQSRRSIDPTRLGEDQ